MTRGSLATSLLLLVTSMQTISAMSQPANLRPGLMLDYYVIQAPDQAQGPTGRSMATLVDTTGAKFSYLVPFEIEPNLNQFSDQLWGLQWSGYLKIVDSGPHTFNLMLSSSGKDKNAEAFGAKCSGWLKLEDRKIVAHDLEWFPAGTRNAYGDIQLGPGIYELEVWLGCSDVGSLIQRDGLTGAAETLKLTQTVNVRGPEDAMLGPIESSRLLYQP